uniref:Uncharacterized protein n=1 Tax=Rhodocyclus tenuis TaxID=1066 RepID=A0A840G763_RHOTE|nr:hypothetical protein [Rhodocyclus tenuis]
MFSQDDLDSIADRLKHRPRATDAVHSPPEVFARMPALVHQPASRSTDSSLLRLGFETAHCGVSIGLHF